MAKKRVTKPGTVLCRIDMSKHLHRRLVMFSVFRGMKLGEVVAEILDKHLPRYDV